jgi:hypothetical protein
MLELLEIVPELLFFAWTKNAKFNAAEPLRVGQFRSIVVAPLIARFGIYRVPERALRLPAHSVFQTASSC